MFPSVCFTITQLHNNSSIHNSSSGQLRCVIDYLVECDLLDCISKGIKTARRSTAVYVKRLPLCDDDGIIDNDHKLMFAEKLEEFRLIDGTLNVDEYIKINSRIELQGTGIVTDDLLEHFELNEYVKIDLTPLQELKKKGSFCKYLSDLISCLIILAKSGNRNAGEITSTQQETSD